MNVFRQPQIRVQNQHPDIGANRCLAANHASGSDQAIQNRAAALASGRRHGW
jgi:hypothetical protein